LAYIPNGIVFLDGGFLSKAPLTKRQTDGCCPTGTLSIEITQDNADLAVLKQNRINGAACAKILTHPSK